MIISTLKHRYFLVFEVENVSRTDFVDFNLQRSIAGAKDHNVNAIHFLMEKYETEVFPSSPHPIALLINMDGWVKGIGYQILTALMESLKPTHLVQILGETKGQIFDIPPTLLGNNTDDEEPTEKSTAAPPRLYQIPACQLLPGASLCRIPASTMRNFRWATYFLPHQLQTFDAWDFASAKSLQTGWIVATNSDKTTTVPYWWPSANAFDETGDDDEEEEDKNDGELSDECRLAQALARERPYCVPMEAVEAFVIGSDFEDNLKIPGDDIGEIHDGIVDAYRNRIYQALNGCVVALCTNTTTMETLGYGILRSIDWEQRLLYVLVPPSVVF